MSCKNSDMPINVDSTSKTCDLTCSFSYTYGNSDLSVTNNGDHLAFSYDGNSTVIYNGDNYNVQDIRLYKPSLNSYYGSKIDAELLIHHVSATGQNLLLCIPIVSNNSSSASNTMFNKIIPFVPSKLNENRTINVSNYTLNYFIPKSGFYSYTGNLPYEPCNGNYNIILFDSRNTINMNPNNLSTLGSIIKPLNVTMKTGDSSKLQFNKTGTTENTLTGEDEIYIDCQPVNEEENIAGATQTLETISVSKTNGVTSPSYERNMKYVEIIGGIAGGLLLFHFLTKGASRLYTKLSTS
jgi:carbonic anhydrase